MPDNLSDRRAQRTKRGLQDVLIKLLQTRNLQKISIRELTELADISRGTFYLHYTDIFDLYQAVEDSVVDGITAIVASPSPVKDEDSLEHMIGAIFEYLAEHINACEALLRTDSASFLAHVFARNRPSSKETWGTIFGTDDHARAYSYVFISYGFAGILKHWMDNGKRETPRQIASIVKQLLSSYMLLEDQNESASGTRK